MPLTIRQVKIAEANGIPYKTLKHRYYDGWDEERMLTQPHREPFEEWEKHKHLCKTNGISYMTYYQRVNEYGMTPMDAATEPVKRNHGDRVRKFPKEYRDIALSNGIPKWKYYDRIRKGMTPEQAATEKWIKRRKEKLS
jgi:hypothetical protein